MKTARNHMPGRIMRHTVTADTDCQPEGIYSYLGVKMLSTIMRKCLDWMNWGGRQPSVWVGPEHGLGPGIKRRTWTEHQHPSPCFLMRMWPTASHSCCHFLLQAKIKLSLSCFLSGVWSQQWEKWPNTANLKYIINVVNSLMTKMWKLPQESLEQLKWA